MKRAAFLALAIAQLLCIALVWVVVMPLLLAARGIIAVCTEGTRRPVMAALVIVAVGLLLWIT